MSKKIENRCYNETDPVISTETCRIFTEKIEIIILVGQNSTFIFIHRLEAIKGNKRINHHRPW